jgi:hypothetical protein
MSPVEKLNQASRLFVPSDDKLMFGSVNPTVTTPVNHTLEAIADSDSVVEVESGRSLFKPVNLKNDQMQIKSLALNCLHLGSCVTRYVHSPWK